MSRVSAQFVLKYAILKAFKNHLMNELQEFFLGLIGNHGKNLITFTEDVIGAWDGCV